jgi:regulator of nucleoside diphosphate kinase
LLVRQLERTDLRDQVFIKSLKNEILRAKVLPATSIPGDVVTMNSRVQLTDMANGQRLVFEIVYPGDSDFEIGKISILSPIGTALLGYRVEDTVLWEVPGGTRTLKIDKVLYQPEAAGDFFQ